MKTNKILLLSLLFTAFLNKANAQNQNGQKNSLTDTSTIEVKTIHSNEGWGYDIYMDGSLFIHQPNIPAVSGNKGFKTKRDAEETGELVKIKIKGKKDSFPTITTNELDSLGVEK